MDQDLTPYAHRSSRAGWTPAPVDPEPALRVGEVERASACDALAEHYAAGRLDPAELDDRLARAVAARSREDLRVLFLDLGPRRRPPSPAEASPPVVDRPRVVSWSPLLVTVLVLSLMMAGGMLMILGAVDPGLFVAALVGGTATGIAGVCSATLFRDGWQRRPR